MKKIILSGILAAVILGIAGLIISHRSEILAINEIDAASFSPELIAQGEKLHAVGDCAVCHTSQSGKRDAGGFPFETLFGTLYSTNITPDRETGIGKWSFEAFERSMREGVNREGNYLYPAFPYTSFTRTTDEDLKALYAYLMTREPVSYQAPKNTMMFPFSIRRGMYAWNLLFLKKGELEHVVDQSEEWNRGRYLTEGLGHCSACHSPRNFAMVEKSGIHHLSGGIAEEWYAPALNGKDVSPNAWTKQDFIDYMKTGFSKRHSVAAGPMAPVITEGLSKIDDKDREAIAEYLVSFQVKSDDANLKTRNENAEQRTLHALNNQGARIFTGSCMSCHAQDSGAQMYGTRPSLTLNTHFYVDEPNNVIRAVLDGIQAPATDEIGVMPAFRNSLNDEQLSQVLNYIRENFANKPAWPNLEKQIKRIRDEK